MSTTRTYSIATPMEFLMWQEHMLVSSERYGVSNGCDCVAQALYPAIISQQLSPGTYQTHYCANSIAIHSQLVPIPAAPPTNTDCSAAATIPSGGGYVEPHVFDSLPRYYQFTKSSTYAGFVYVTSSMRIGHIYTLSVRTQCDDPSTEVARGSVPFPYTGVAMVTIPSGLPTGQYWIVASGIERGLEYVISVGP